MLGKVARGGKGKKIIDYAETIILIYLGFEPQFILINFWFLILIFIISILPCIYQNFHPLITPKMLLHDLIKYLTLKGSNSSFRKRITASPFVNFIMNQC